METIMKEKNAISRRQFLKRTSIATASAIGFPYLISSSALGANGSVAASNRITLGCIGVGWMGGDNMNAFLNQSDCQVVAVCDLDQNHLNNAKNRVDGVYGNTDCKPYHDFRDLLARPDIDAVSIATPDHWHAICAITAAKAGKDIYSEKPLSHTLEEGRAMCNAVKRYSRVWQTGSWQRSVGNFRFACELVLNGRIGKIQRVEVGLPSGFSDFGNAGQETICPPPPELDYDFWLGPAPWEPYCPARVHKSWRWHLDYGGGQLMDWVGHHVDIAHWGLGFDYTGPVEVDGRGEFPRNGLWNAATKYYITVKYTNGLEMIIAGGYDEIGHGTKWIGKDGWVWVNRGFLEAHPKSLLQEKFSPNEVNLYHSPGHQRNFLDCIKTRAATLTPCEVAHRSASPGHLGQISMLLGRKIRFNPDTEEIINDLTATQMLGNAMRSPWRL
jgi:predicted dehydrogenase